MISAKEIIEKKRIPSTLVECVIRAREANGKVLKELNLYLEKCQKEKLKPKEQWIQLLQWLSEGKEMISILDALQIHPRNETFLKILESLKAHGFPDHFLNNLISEIPSDYLSDKAKDNLRKWLSIPLDLYRHGPGFDVENVG